MITSGSIKVLYCIAVGTHRPSCPKAFAKKDLRPMPWCDISELASFHYFWHCNNFPSFLRAYEAELEPMGSQENLWPGQQSANPPASQLLNSLTLSLLSRSSLIVSMNFLVSFLPSIITPPRSWIIPYLLTYHIICPAVATFQYRIIWVGAGRYNGKAYLLMCFKFSTVQWRSAVFATRSQVLVSAQGNKTPRMHSRCPWNVIHVRANHFD